MNKSKHILYILLLVIFFSTDVANCQPPNQLVKVLVAPDHTNWTYKTGEEAKFTITVLRYGNPVPNVKIKYEIGPEKMEPVKRDSLNLADGKITLSGGTMKTPGFLRCTVTAFVDDKEYRNLATAGYDPEAIKPTEKNPADFVAFWDKARADLAKIPMDAKMTLMPERCTENVNVYHVNLQNFRVGTRLYGILCVPKKEGKYPALLRVPGAGVRPYGGDIGTAERGIITFEIGIHGIPVNLDASVYTSLGSGILNDYTSQNLDDRDKYFYKRVYVGCLRANDFLTSLPQYDGKNLGVAGGSQGGALSIVTAALDKRVKYLVSFYPAISDVTGYLEGRAGGWPHLFTKNNLTYNNTKEKLNTVQYYDVVNFARLLKVPGMYSWGFNDEVCPPTSTYSAYNVITAPKQLFLALETGHWTFPEQNEKTNNWLVDKLKNK
ncbi:MAG: Cephalosporin-C deacetylase [Segetibacter sp.]|nr:Cephalosporin-C deacetylase [Segetibacter sp.]